MVVECIDGERDEFYAWVLAEVVRRGGRRAEVEGRHPLRAQAFGAAAWFSGAESCDRDACAPYPLCGATMFSLLRDAWAAGYNAGRSTQ